MTEVQFVLRRILKEGYEYAERERKNDDLSPASSLYRYTNHLQLLSHLEEQFLERNENDTQD
jgi:hypothetical protein